MKKNLFILGLFLFSLANVEYTFAQDTEFWFTSGTPQHYSTVNGYFVFTNTTDKPATVNVDLFHTGVGIDTTYTIPGNGAWVLKYNETKLSTDIESPRNLAGTVQNYGVYITSDENIIGYYLYDGYANKDMYSLKGANALGKTFYIPQSSDGQLSNYSYFSTSAFDQADIVATATGTTEVKVTPTRPCVGMPIAGTTYTFNLTQGQTLKLMETAQGTFGVMNTLAGTKVEASQPIAISSLQDWASYSGYSKADMGADQIVPIDNLGTKFAIVKGYSNSTSTDRIYILATKDGTNVYVTTTVGGPETLLTTTPLHAGESTVFDMGNRTVDPYCISIRTTNPAYCMQFTADEQQPAKAVIPSIFSIGYYRFSFYQLGASTSGVKNNMVYMIVRDTCENYFKYSYDGNTYDLMSNVTILQNDLVPGIDGWRYIRAQLPSSSDDKVVTISNSESAFSLNYLASESGNYDFCLYGVLSGFGSFDFGVDTIYQCRSGEILTGGFAKSYTWKYSSVSKDGPYTTLSDTTVSILADKEGYYALLMDQDPKIISDTVFVRLLNFDAKVQPVNVLQQDDSTKFSVDLNPILFSDPNISVSYEWKIIGGTPTASTSATPTVSWTSNARGAQVSITATANSERGLVVCDTTINILIVTITPENKWSETDPDNPDKPKWNSKYDKENGTAWYSGCDMILSMALVPDGNNDRTVNLGYLGALKKGFVVDTNGEILKNSYSLAKGDSVFELHFSILEDSITSENVGKLGAMEAEVVGCGRDTSDWFNLYSNPTYENIYVKPVLRSDKTVDFGIIGGSPNLMCSINGRAWRNAYLPFTAAEQLCLTDSAVIWLREPNGCWEAQFFFMSVIDPMILRYVDIPKTDGVTTVPAAGKHYVEGHNDFSFTASYKGGSPLKVMASGYYSGIDKELIGQNMDDGTYKYTVVQVTEPWNITFGPELASGTVGNGTIDGTSVWSYKNMLYVNTEAGTIVRIYNMSGSLCKQFTASGSSICGESLQSGVYVVAVGDVRYKVVIR